MKLSPVSKRRIATLIAFMRALPKSANKHFYMGSWVRGIPYGDTPITAKVFHGCGTSACAAGWGATIVALKKQGFKYARNGGFTIQPESFFGVSGGGCDDLAQTMFYSDARTPKQWAREVERAVKSHEKQYPTGAAFA